MIKQFKVGKYYRINKKFEKELKNILESNYDSCSLYNRLLELIKTPKKCIEIGHFPCCSKLQDVNSNENYKFLCFMKFLIYIEECESAEFIQEELEV